MVSRHSCYHGYGLFKRFSLRVVRVTNSKQLAAPQTGFIFNFCPTFLLDAKLTVAANCVRQLEVGRRAGTQVKVRGVAERHGVREERNNQRRR